MFERKFLGKVNDILVFFWRQRAVNLRVKAGTVLGGVLAHQAERYVRHPFVFQPKQKVITAGQVVRKHKMPHDYPSQRHSVLDDQGTALGVFVLRAARATSG